MSGRNAATRNRARGVVSKRLPLFTLFKYLLRLEGLRAPQPLRGVNERPQHVLASVPSRHLPRTYSRPPKNTLNTRDSSTPMSYIIRHTCTSRQTRVANASSRVLNARGRATQYSTCRRSKPPNSTYEPRRPHVDASVRHECLRSCDSSHPLRHLTLENEQRTEKRDGS